MAGDLSLLVGVVILTGVSGFLATACRTGTLPRNGVVGVRTKATMSSDEAWDAGHRAAAPALRRTAWFGLVLIAITVIVLVIVEPGEDPGWEFLFPVVGFVGVTVGICLAGVVANRVAKEILAQG